MANRIYRGPANIQPQTVTAKMLKDLQAGVIVRITNTGFDLPDDGLGNLHVLNTADYMGGVPDDVRKTGDTAEAFRMVSKTEFLVRMEAGAYTKGQPLTLSLVTGYLKNADATDKVIAHFDEPNRTLVAGGLADVITA